MRARIVDLLSRLRPRLRRFRRAAKVLLRADARIRRALDRILPSNLTARYILGLGVIALLATFGQILAQASLRDQLDDQKLVRFLDRQIPLANELRKATVALQLSSSPSETQHNHATVRSLVARISATQSAIEQEPRFLRRLDDSGVAIALKQSLYALGSAASSLSSVIPSPSAQGPWPVSTAEYATQISKELLDAATATEEQLKNAVNRLEVLSEARVSNFSSKELGLYFGTLLMLVIEAFYVFRPAVERLYNALRTRSEFLGRMSHELRNPLNSIIGMGKLLSETPVTEQQRRYLSVLGSSGGSLLEILNGILDFASFESGRVKLERREFELAETIDRCLDLSVVAAHANGNELVLDLDPSFPARVEGDPVRLQQVLSNLLGNAVKFTRNGTVVLRVSADAGEAGGQGIRFSVSDTGVGIAPENLERIFEPFVQEDASVRRSFGGTGLGLPISRELIEKMGGILEVRSRKNFGSVFAFTLPLGPRGGAHPDPARPLAGHAPFEAVLLEPNVEAREALSRLLATAGAQVVAASDPEDAARLLWADGGDRRILVADLDSFRGNPDPVLRGSRRGRVIFLLRTTASTQQIERLVTRGAGGILFKPVRPAQILESIERILTGRGAAREIEEAPPEERRTLRILVADDSRENQVLYAAYLQTMACILEFADNGREAVDKFRRGGFDVVLMDIQMPEMDGYTAAGLIRAWEDERGERARVPILGISAFDMDAALLKSFTDYRVKPVGPAELRRAIRALARALPTAEPEAPRRSLAERIAALAPAYLENRRKEVGALEGLLRRAEFGPIERIGHQMRGNASSYGFPVLGEAGAELEAAARARDAAAVEAALQRIRGELG